MMDGDGSHLMFERSFTGPRKLEFLICLHFCLCFLVGPYPPNWYNPPLREKDFFYVCLLA
jgi:hypothetical protein